MSGNPPVRSLTNPALWLRTEAEAWLVAGTAIKERRAVQDLAVVKVVSEFIYGGRDGKSSVSPRSEQEA